MRNLSKLVNVINLTKSIITVSSSAQKFCKFYLIESDVREVPELSKLPSARVILVLFQKNKTKIVSRARQLILIQFFAF